MHGAFLSSVMWRREVLSASARGDAILTCYGAWRTDLTRAGSKLRGTPTADRVISHFLHRFAPFRAWFRAFRARFARVSRAFARVRARFVRLRAASRGFARLRAASQFNTNFASFAPFVSLSRDFHGALRDLHMKFHMNFAQFHTAFRTVSHSFTGIHQDSHGFTCVKV